MTPPAYLLIALARTYQWTIRPLIGPNCRFWPSCSDYAIESVRTHGAASGGWLAARRVLRCNPWHPGGYDPVPPCDCHHPSFQGAGDRGRPDGHDHQPRSDGARIQQPRQGPDIKGRLHAVGIQQRLRAARPSPKAL